MKKENKDDDENDIFTEEEEKKLYITEDVENALTNMCVHIPAQ